MLERRKEKRTRRTIQLIAIPLIVLIGGYLIWNTFGNGISPAEPTVTVAPTNTLVPVDTATPLPPDTDNDGFIDAEDDCPELAGHEDFGGCPHPDTWDLNVEFEDWQKKIVLEDLQVFWTAFMSPVPGTLPNCSDQLLETIYSKASGAIESIKEICQEMLTEGTYVVRLPLHTIPTITFYYYPDAELPQIEIVLKTETNWIMEVRFINDGGLQKTLDSQPTKYNINLVLEDGVWKILAVTFSQ